MSIGSRQPPVGERQPHLIGERDTPAVQQYHVEPDGQADGQSLWLLHSSPLRSKLEARILSYYLSSTRAILIHR